MANLRQMIDGSGVTIASGTPKKSEDDVFDHFKNAAKAKADYETTRAKLATKLAPTQKMLQLTQQAHGGPDPTNDPFAQPFQNPSMQEGPGGPGGVGQGLENQDDLARTGQMKRGMVPSSPSERLQNTPEGAIQPGKKTTNDGNKKLETPASRAAQGKAPQRSASGNKPPGKQTQPTDGKKKGKHIKLEISDGDKMSAMMNQRPNENIGDIFTKKKKDDNVAAGGPGSGRHPGYGGFQRTTSGRGFATYEHPKGHWVGVTHDKKGGGTVEYQRNSASFGKIGEGTKPRVKNFASDKDLSNHLKSTYGISHSKNVGEAQSIPKYLKQLKDDNVAAGGPGSGRHPEYGNFEKTQVTESKNPAGSKFTRPPTMTHHYSDMEDKNSVAVHERRAGGWSVKENGVVTKQGAGSSALAQHMKERYGIKHATDYNWSDDSMAADYHDDAGKSMPSVAHGLAASRTMLRGRIRDIMKRI